MAKPNINDFLNATSQGAVRDYLTALDAWLTATNLETGMSPDLKLFTNAAGTAREWAKGIKIGTFTRDTSLTGTQAITGLGFKPSVVFFMVSIIDTPQVSFGIDDGANRYCTINTHSVTANSWSFNTSYPIQLMQSSSIYSRGYISTMGSDGFTLTWTATGAKTGTAQINYIAFR